MGFKTDVREKCTPVWIGFRWLGYNPVETIMNRSNNGVFIYLNTSLVAQIVLRRMVG
jgi:hypothetical protein